MAHFSTTLTIWFSFQGDPGGPPGLAGEKVCYVPLRAFVISNGSNLEMNIMSFVLNSVTTGLNFIAINFVLYFQGSSGPPGDSGSPGKPVSPFSSIQINELKATISKELLVGH